MPSLDMPNVGEGVTEGTVVRWIKQEGDAVQIDEPVVEIETDKAVVEIPSPFEGRLVTILVAADETVPIGTPLAEFALASAAGAPEDDQPAVAPEPAQAATSTDVSAAAAAGGAPRRTRRYSPVVLRLAEEHGVDLSLVEGRGVGGRVTRKDLLSYVENRSATEPPLEGASAGGPAAAAASEAAAVRQPPSARTETAAAAAGDVVPHTATRRSIARHMLQSHQTIPAVWMMVEADVTDLVELRERTKEEFQREHGVSLTYLPFFVQAIVAALKQHPVINSTYTEEGVELHQRYDIGIAVAVEAGLLVPVVREAGSKSIAELARELDELGKKARDRRLTLEEMRGATFTIDNTGAFGSVLSYPIVPMGQTAIITTEVIRRELRVRDDGAFAARSVMNLALSFDHRATDGAQAGRFMSSVRERLEAIQPDDDAY